MQTNQSPGSFFEASKIFRPLNFSGILNFSTLRFVDLSIPEGLDGVRMYSEMRADIHFLYCDHRSCADNRAAHRSSERPAALRRDSASAPHELAERSAELESAIEPRGARRVCVPGIIPLAPLPTLRYQQLTAASAVDGVRGCERLDARISRRPPEEVSGFRRRWSRHCTHTSPTDLCSTLLTRNLFLRVHMTWAFSYEYRHKYGSSIDWRSARCRSTNINCKLLVIKCDCSLNRLTCTRNYLSINYNSHHCINLFTSSWVFIKLELTIIYL